MTMAKGLTSAYLPMGPRWYVSTSAIASSSNFSAIAPPLIVTKDEIDEGIAIMDQALKVADEYTEE